MADPLSFSLSAVAFVVLPMYVANATAMLLRGTSLLDFNTKLSDKQPLFGKGKTIKGTVGGIVSAGVFGFLAAQLFPLQSAMFGISYVQFSFLAGLGAILGDIAASFVKRRLGFPPGHEIWLLDQLDFLAGGIAFCAAFYFPSAMEIAFLVALTLVMHRVSNFVAFKAKLKQVPW